MAVCSVELQEISNMWFCPILFTLLVLILVDHGHAWCYFSGPWLACSSIVCNGVSYCASGDMLGGMLAGCAWWCASRGFWCVLWLWFLVVHGVSLYAGLCFKLVCEVADGQFDFLVSFLRG